MLGARLCNTLLQGVRFGEYAFLKGHKKPVHSVNSFPDGNTLASVCDDNTVRIWDVSRGVTLKELKGHTNPVISVEFSPDGKRVTSGALDKTVRAWDLRNGTTIEEFGRNGEKEKSE